MAAAVAVGEQGAASGAAATVEVFGPQRYVRTTGPKDEYTTAVTVPAWVASPFIMRIWNGEANGTYRVSSAWVAVNGAAAAAAPADFNQNVYTLDRAVALTPQTTLKVTLASKPTSYLSIGLFGTNADHTAPQVRVDLPLPGSVTNDATPSLRVRYEDRVGEGEPAASGVDSSTLRIDFDGTDRTALFTRRTDEATAEWPDALALSQGTHEVRARVKDHAGNEGEAVASFRVDLTRPVIEVTAPPEGAFLASTTPVLRVTYRDEVDLDLSSLTVLVNGVDRTGLFTIGPGEATVQLDARSALPPGVNTVHATIRDRGGNAADGSSSFHVDVEPPMLTIGEPLDGSRNGKADLRVVVHYGDDQELDYATFTATLDGAPLPLIVGPTGALGSTGPLSDDEHVLVASIRDRAGNRKEALSRFTVDTTVPEIAIVNPPSGAKLNTGAPVIALSYADAQGVDLASLRLTVNGQDRTSWCVTADATASCPVPATEPLADQAHEVVATIDDLTGNDASATTKFEVDTVAPTATLIEPTQPVKTAAPTLRLAFSDVGVGVDAAAVVIRIDGNVRTGDFAVSNAGAVGVVAGLADGRHSVEVRLRDLAWNETIMTDSFVVDTMKPALAIVSPAADSFGNDATPALAIAWSDTDGSGIAAGTAHLFLKNGGGLERDVTGWLSPVTASGATGDVPAADALADGTHHLRAVVADAAGNTSEMAVAFVVDTVRPTYTVDLPAKGSFVATTTPRFVIRYQDERSGVSLPDVRLHLDGADRTARLAVGPEEASGTLTPAEALAQGRHAVEVTVRDRAGNEAAPVPHTFTVDTVPPVAAVVLPAEGAYLGETQPRVRVTYADADVGASPPVASVQVFVDGVDRTSAFVIGPASAEATLAENLTDGRHTVRVDVLDWAANPATASRDFEVDTAAPTVAISAPDEGSYHRASPVTFTGTVTDADPQPSASCATPSASVAAALTASEGSSSFTCAVPLAEGENTVTVTARDRLAHEAAVSRSVVLDTVKPQVTIVQPTRGEYTNASEITVSGGVVDTSPVTLKVNGVDASISGSAFTATVPVGSGPEVALTAVAEDAAGNTGQDEVSVKVDRTNPVVRITSPTSGVYVKGPVLDVMGTVADESPASLVDVNGVIGEVSGGSFTARVPVTDGPLTLLATAQDAAGNPGTDTISLVVDSGPPVITITEPAADTITNLTQIRVSGTVQDATEVTLTTGGSPIPVVGASFSFDAPLPTEGRNVIALAATDQAGNSSSAEVAVVRDTIAPTLTIASPAQDAVVGALPVIVQGTVQDATEVGVTVDGTPASRTGAAWQASLASMAEGPHTFTIIATDQAGNVTTLSRDVVMDLGPPVVAITAPATGTLTRDATTTVTGTVVDRSTVTVSIELPSGAAIPATVQRTATDTYAFTAAGVALAEGDNRLVARATDASGRTAEAAVTVTRDSTPPQVALAAPDAISRGRGGEATATATDAIAVAQVTLTAAVSASCTAGQQTQAAPPYVLPLAVPACAKPGDTIVVTAVATDTAGNTSSTSRGVRVLSDGVVVGQVLDDSTGRPLPGATVTLTGGTQPTPVTRTTDETGRYSISTGDLGALIMAERSGMTSVEREVTVESGVGTVPVDARLTPLAEPKALGAGDPHTAGAVTITGPAGAYQFTALSAQGLPGLLPLGWSPLAAFDLRVDTAGPFTATIVAPSSSAGTSPGLHLVRYSAGLHAWVMEAADLATTTTTTTTITVGLGQPGAYAVVAADVMDPALAVAAVGQPLAGTDAVLLAATVTARTNVDPAVLPPSGGLSRGTVTIVSPVPLPSGTVVQAEVTETYTLASGDVASEEKRRQDVVAFRTPIPPAVTIPDPPPAPGTELYGVLPISPARSFTFAELVRGTVHLDILAGRESVRGKTGGSEAVIVQDGDATLAVPARALAEDTAVWMAKTPLTAGLPSDAGLTPISEVAIDFAGNRLGLAAELSVSASGLPTDGTYVIARQTRIDGIVELEIVSMAGISGDRLTSRAHAGFTGIVQGGRYVFYRIAAAVGFLAGRVTSTAGPQRGAVVEAPGLPFIALSAADGAYALVAVTGAVTATARVPRTSLAGTGSATVVAAETAALDIALVGVVSTATVTPADGATAVLTNAQVEIVTPIALQPSSVTAQNVRLLALGTDAAGTATATPVPVRLILSSSGKLLAVVPETALAFATTYRVDATGMVDVFGGLVNVPAHSFTTKDDTPPVYDLNALVFSFPDVNGIVTLTAPPGSLPPGTEILVINATSGFVGTFTIENDGGLGTLLPATMPATINDRLLVTITDPFGNVTTFERSQFVNPATGETAVGPGGGVVTATDGSGVELRIPKDATDKGVTLKIAGMTAADLAAEFPSQQPDLPGATVASGLKIESADKPTFKKEIDLVFPKPQDAPDGAFYYVFRRIARPDGTALFETIDHAFVECPQGQTTCADADKKVVTASWPFGGYFSSFGGFSAGGALAAVAINHVFLMWTINSLLPGAPSSGAVTGKVYRAAWATGGTAYLAEPFATVTVVDSPGNTLAVTQRDGTFTAFDPRYTGGPVAIEATRSARTEPDGTVIAAGTERTTATQANPADWSTSGLRFYSNIATGNVTFPASAPPAPPPAIRIRLWRETTPRAEIFDPAFIVAGTSVTATFETDGAALTSVTLQGQDCTVLPSTVPPSVDFVSDQRCTIGLTGTYTLTASALPAFGSVVSSSKTFVVVASAGDNNRTAQTGPPRAMAFLPRDLATGVGVGVLPQVTFNEPVRLGGLVHLRVGSDTGDEIPVTVVGITTSDTVVDVTSPGALEPVRSVTIKPAAGLQYGQRYFIVLDDTIRDTDDSLTPPVPANTLAAPYSASFTTFTPDSVGGTPTDGAFGSPGLVVLEDRAYLVQNYFSSGMLRVFDVSDPVAPQEVAGERPSVTGRPADITGQQETEVTAGRMVAVATTSTSQSKPSNIYLFDAADDARTAWIGAASLTNSATDGFVYRIALHGSFLYAATGRKGIQVVDLVRARDNFQGLGLHTAAYWSAIRAFNTDGQGWGNDAVVRTISTGSRLVYDLDVMALSYGGVSQPLVAAVSDGGFYTVNPQTGSILREGPISNADATVTLISGDVLALGRVGTSDIAVVVGAGTASGSSSAVLLTALDIADPASPRLLGSLDIAEAMRTIDPPPPAGCVVGGATDVLLKDTSALVAMKDCVAIVSLADLARPVLSGLLANMGGRLAFGPGELLYSTERSVFGTTTTATLRSATLGRLALIHRLTPNPVLVDMDGDFLESQSLAVRTIPPLTTNDGVIAIEENQAPYQRLLVPVTAGEGTTTWTAQAALDPRRTYEGTPEVRDDSNTLLPAITKRLPVTRLPLMAETRDRQIEVRFAVPATSTTRYALQLFVAAGDGALPQSPTLVIPWSRIESAYESIDEVFDDVTPNSARAGEPFVIRKIRRVVVPGVPELSSQRAFAMEAVFGGYHRYRVSVVEEGTTPREFARVEGQPVYDPAWAQMVDDLSLLGRTNVASYPTHGPVRVASMGVLPMFQMVGPTWLDFSGLVARALLPIKSLLGYARDDFGRHLARSIEFQLARGIVTGFVDGLVGDWQLVRHPIDSFNAIKASFAELADLRFSSADAVNLVTNAYASLQAANLGSFIPTPLAAFDYVQRTQGQAAYYAGYLSGMLLWQIASTLVIGIATATVGAVAVKVGIAARGGAFAVRIAAWMARALRVLGRVFDFAADRARQGLSVAEATQIWKVSREIADGPMLVLTQKYTAAMRTAEPALKVIATSTNFGKRLVEQFARIAALPDEAADRILRYMVSRGEAGNPVFRWLDIYQNRRLMTGGIESNRAIKEALEVPEFASTLPDELNDVIVSAADLINRGDGVGADNLVKAFAEKYRTSPEGNRLQGVLRRLKSAPDDSRYSNVVIGRTIEAHADPRFGPMPDSSFEGTAKLIALRECLQ